MLCIVASVLIDLKRYDEALGIFETALQLAPDLAEFHVNRSQVCSGRAHYDERSATCRFVLKLRTVRRSFANNVARLVLVCNEI